MDRCIVIFLFVAVVSTMAQEKYRNIQVDQRGRVLDKDQLDCAKVRTLGMTDLLDVPMDSKEVMAIVRQQLCFFDYDDNQRQQFNLCLKVGVNTGHLLPTNVEASAIVDLVETTPLDILCEQLSVNLTVKEIQLRTVQSLQQLIGYGCDARQVTSSIAKCIINQPNLDLPCISVPRIPKGNCQAFEPSPRCENLEKQTLTCPHPTSLDAESPE